MTGSRFPQRKGFALPLVMIFLAMLTALLFKELVGLEHLSEHRLVVEREHVVVQRAYEEVKRIEQWLQTAEFGPSPTIGLWDGREKLALSHPQSSGQRGNMTVNVKLYRTDYKLEGLRSYDRLPPQSERPGCWGWVTVKAGSCEGQLTFWGEVGRKMVVMP